ncbi:unnamed protein product [Orchesella dallaii]|uniref:Gustatory receptor n=1 Tax=Orchesella dallaii TaxID=48710 RepID=A0ABP1RT31_9HEXA
MNSKEMFVNAGEPIYPEGDKICKTILLSRSSFLSRYFTIGYYLLIVPFKPEYKEDGSCILKVSKLQKSLCYIGPWTSTLLKQIATNIRNILGKSTVVNGGVADYFAIVSDLLYCIRVFTFWNSLFHRSETIRNILETIHTSSLFKLNNSGNQLASHVYLNSRYLIAGCLSQLYFYRVHTFNFSEFSFTAHFHTYVAEGWGKLLLQSNKSESILNGQDDLQLIDITIGILSMVMSFGYLMLWFFVDLFANGPLPLTLWVATNQFQKLVFDFTKNDEECEQKREMWSQILEKYDELKTCSDSINSLWSLYVLMWVCDTGLSVFFLTRREFRSVGSYNSVAYFIYPMYISVCLAGALILLADVYRKVKCIKSCIIRRATRGINWVHETELKPLLRELETNPIGLGSDGIFQVNYSFLAQWPSIYIKSLYVLALVNMLIVFLRPYDTDLHNYSLSSHFRKYVNEGWGRLFQEHGFIRAYNNSTNVSDGTYEDFELVDIAVGVGNILVSTAFQTVWVFADVMVYGPLPLTLWVATNDFEGLVTTFLKKDEESHSRKRMWITILQKYEELKTCSDSINENWSLYIIMWISDSGLTVSFLTKNALKSISQSLFDNVYVFFVSFYLIAVLIISAEVCRKITCVRSSLMRQSNNLSWIDEAEFKTLLRDLKSNPIGFGSDGVYRVTYSFFAQRICLLGPWIATLLIQILEVALSARDGRQGFQKASRYLMNAADFIYFARLFVFWYCLTYRSKTIKDLLEMVNKSSLHDDTQGNADKKCLVNYLILQAA